MMPPQSLFQNQYNQQFGSPQQDGVQMQYDQQQMMADPNMMQFDFGMNADAQMQQGMGAPQHLEMMQGMPNVNAFGLMMPGLAMPAPSLGAMGSQQGYAPLGQQQLLSDYTYSMPAQNMEQTPFMFFPEVQQQQEEQKQDAFKAEYGAAAEPVAAAAVCEPEPTPEAAPAPTTRAAEVKPKKRKAKGGCC